MNDLTGRLVAVQWSAGHEIEDTHVTPEDPADPQRKDVQASSDQFLFCQLNDFDAGASSGLSGTEDAISVEFSVQSFQPFHCPGIVNPAPLLAPCSAVVTFTTTNSRVPAGISPTGMKVLPVSGSLKMPLVLARMV